MKIIKLFIFIILLSISNIYGIELPVNSSEKWRISNWVIAKIEDFNNDHIKVLKDNPDKFFQSLPEDRVRELNLSNYNDVTISLYQLYSDINFNSTLIMACAIETKNEQTAGFSYYDFDMDATIYINGIKAMSELSGDKAFFEKKLKNGKNTVFIIIIFGMFSKSIFSKQNLK